MNETNLKIIGKPEPEEAQPPTFPVTNVQVVPQGLIINTMLAPGLSIGQMIDEASMNAICQQWLQSRKQIKRDMELVQHIKRTKND